MKSTLPHLLMKQAIAINVLASLGLPAAEAFPITEANSVEQADASFEPGRVLAINASQFTANNPHEFLSNYAIRYSDPNAAALDSIQAFIAPPVRANFSQFVEYPVYNFADAQLILDNTTDDVRAIGADYPTLRNPTKALTTQKLPTRGLAIEVDEDEEQLDPDWQQQKVKFLIDILSRTSLRRTIVLAIAGASNVAKTWDTTAGKDPDLDILNELEGQSLRANRILFGPAAATKRKIAHRAQNTAGGFASAGLSDEELASFLGLDSVITARPKYTTGASAATNLMGSYALLFSAQDAMTRMDFSNLKTFWAPTKTGQPRQVFVRQVGDKRWRIAVDAGRRLEAVTSTIGLETITVS